ncbi:MAG: hypothetical protein GVY08_06030 [Bacteroidetes bacterium]|jgi:hypothetical protein|nr:hypothetical protein [Bacteroidota bacterium]
MMKKIGLTFVAVVIIALGTQGCSDIFGSKDNRTTDEIFEEGRIDPTLERVDGYAALTPFWGNFDNPTDVFVGFDGFVYVTDAVGLHALDRADLAPRRTIELPGAVSVTQDRLLNVYVAARYDTVISELPDERGEQTWNLPAVYKIKNLNGAGEITFQDTLIHPFDDNSRATTASEQFRLDRSRADNDELVEFTGVGVLRDNKIYVSRRGPRNIAGALEAGDNTVLQYEPVVEDGVTTPKMRNINQVRSLNPRTPSLLSAIGLSDITTFINPPQRDRFPDDRNFLIAQADQERTIPFRVLQVNVVETPDGTAFQPNQDFLVRDTSRADGFLYEEGKFIEPAGLAVAGDETGYIFVIDKARHKLFQFKPNGEEGIDPPPAAVDRSRNLTVSFGGLGNGPRQFNSPSGVAYFDEIVYVADTGNNRIARYRLTTDFE